MNKKYQIFIIHGGMTFKSHKDYLHFLKTRKISIEKRISWAGEYLEKSLGKNYEIVRLRMPLQDNAQYEDWKICFQRYVPYFNSKTILFGNSLGGIFLAKYLSEHKLPKKVLSTYLICAPFDGTITGEDLVGGFKLKSDISLLEKNSKNLYLLFSEDDDIVPPSHAEKYRKKLKNAKIIVYKNKNGHFNISKFPEIIKMIKSDTKKA